MANHSKILDWRITWTEEPGSYSPKGHKELDKTEVTEHARMHKQTNREENHHYCGKNVSFETDVIILLQVVNFFPWFSLITS